MASYYNRRIGVKHLATAFCVLAPALLPAMSVRDALGQIESGDNDLAVGRAGEVSRYQIHPSVWKFERPSLAQNPHKAWDVARMILILRCAAFEERTGRSPTARELYALWNAPGSFKSKGYQFHRLSAAVRERAIRFSNLVNHR